MARQNKGRMVNKDISNSLGFAELSREAAVLFVMMIPHYNAHGKMNGGSGYIKDEVCPRISYLTMKNIPKLLSEITKHTNVKWFEKDGRHWIHSINFLNNHQKLSKSRLGVDILPDYSVTTPELSVITPELSGVSIPEVEVEVEVEGEGAKNGDAPSGFEFFYKNYPKKRSSGDAEKAWNKLNPDRDLEVCIMTGLELAKGSDSWQSENGLYVPYPATWLRARGWEDEYPTINGVPEGESWKYE